MHPSEQMEQLTPILKNECMHPTNEAISRGSKMGKNWKKKFYDNLYSTPFQQPWANPKHSFSQVNGETQQNQHAIILEYDVRKRS
jgi:hypothetical protein